MIAEVIVDISNSEVDRIFDYAFDEEQAICAGSRVLVPFGNRKIEGYVVNIKETTDCPPDKLKTIAEPLDRKPVILKELLVLMRMMTESYHLRCVDVLKLFIPAQMRGGKVKELVRQYATLHPDYRQRDMSDLIKKTASAQWEIYRLLSDGQAHSVADLNRDYSAAALKNLVMRGIVSIESVEVNRTPYKQLANEAAHCVTLTEEQQAAVSKIEQAHDKTIVLHGVTGSGKTEVYMRCIAKVLQRGQTAIMLVPEISLTPQVLKNFRARFGDAVALLHSGLSAGERYDEWRRLLNGEATVAVGARSAIFAPVSNLGLIIIDEEHDSSYLSESNPRYPTHEVAAFRAHYNQCNLILGSATPSIETYYHAQKGDYDLIELKNRVNRHAMPEIEIVDMCKELSEGSPGIFSRSLDNALAACIERGEQAIIFINRRGYSSYVMCRKCGYVAKCEQCDVSLVYHKDENILKCHYCNNRYSMLDVCPQCKSPQIKQGFMGTQKVVEYLESRFPQVRVLRMDNDTTQGKDAHYKILSAFAAKEAQILVGTQMIAKGHDFPDVTLVGIVDADMSLHFADYRSAERTYQLITQVSGRAGRDRKAGKVVLQTYTPHHYVYRFALANDYSGFYKKEINLREITKYPPFAKIVRVLVTGENEQLAMAVLKSIYQEIETYSSTKREAFAYLGVMRAPLKRMQNKYRMQILMRLVAEHRTCIQAVYQAVDHYNTPKISCFVEINPNDLR